MTATILDLTARLPAPAPQCPDWCARCAFDALSARLDAVAARHDGQLLIPAADLTAVLADVRATAAAVLAAAVVNPSTERTTP